MSFKLVMGDERNKDILAEFLSAILALPVNEFVDIQPLDTLLKKQHKDDKYSILDVNLRTKSRSLINIEIQVAGKKAFEKRSVYYASKRLVNQLGESDLYESLHQTISINIVDFTLFSYLKYHSTFWLQEEELKMLAEKNEVFERPMAEVMRLSADEQVRVEYEARLRAYRDRHAEIAYGIDKGRAEEQHKIAKNMKQLGIGIELITQATGLCADEIKTL